MNRATAALLVAVLLGGISMAAIQRYLRKQQQVESKDRDQVLITNSPIEAGEPLRPERMGFLWMPRETRLLGNFYSFAERDILAVRRAKVRIERGKAITPWMVEDPGRMTAPTPEVLEKDMRLMSVAVDPETGIAGHITPGSRVDLVVTYSSASGTRSGERVASRILLTNLFVYAVDLNTRIGSGAGELKDELYTTITVVVTQEEAQVLAFAKAKGRLQFLLRNKDDIGGMNSLDPVDETNVDKKSDEALGRRRSGEVDRRPTPAP